jgi:uncharacterized protein
MTEKEPEKKMGRHFLTPGRIVLAVLVVLTLVVVAISLTTNLSRMYGTWDAASTSGEQKSSKLRLERLDIVSGDRRHTFSVEVMRDDAGRGRGLMFRAQMPQDEGMLFDFEQDQMVSMWMKNTYLSLDMVFILADGRIHRIESRTEPESERVISSGVPVRAVLELNANVANRLGLRPGDRILHPIFK